MKKELNIYSADLHIHTPASKCYEGAKSDNEYIEIIKTAKKKNLEVVAISDHNSIEGYSKLIEQKSKIHSEIATLQTLSDSEQAQKRILELKKALANFEGILILPAIEFEVNNGIHLLVIFNPNTSLTKIRQFLENGGYSQDSYGFEKSDTISNWSIFDLYEEVKNYDCIVIDGHTDSDKGILNTIPKGNTRAHAFKNSSLSGVCYKNEKQRNQLESTLKTSQEYHRERPLAFLKSSDSHNLNDIGRSKSFFKLEQLDWNNFKKAFENPTEYIFTTYPKVQDIINSILEKENYLTIPKIDNESIEFFLKSVCALNNSYGGYILFGIDEHNTILGLEIKDNKFENFEPNLDMVFKGIERIKGNIKFDFNFYPLLNEKLLIVFRIFKNDKLVDIDNNGQIYSLNEKSICILSAASIQKTVENTTIIDIEKRILKNLKVIELNTSKVRTSLKSLPVLSSFIERSVPLISIIDEPKVLIPEKLDVYAQKALIEYGQENGNGKSKGNIFFFEDEFSPRLKDAFLRYSIPRHYSKDLKFESKNIETVYLVPGGGVFYSKRTMPQFNIKGLPIIQLHIDSKSNYSAKFLCSYLKSSFLLWYLINKHDNVDIFEPEIFQELIVPKINFSNPEERKLISKIENELDTILIQENEFLKLKLNKDNYEDEVMKHNSVIDKHSINIDMAIFELLKLNSETIEIIESTLKANQIHYPINN